MDPHLALEQLVEQSSRAKALPPAVREKAELMLLDSMSDVARKWPGHAAGRQPA
jgi:hypothetical protein